MRFAPPPDRTPAASAVPANLDSTAATGGGTAGVVRPRTVGACLARNLRLSVQTVVPRPAVPQSIATRPLATALAAALVVIASTIHPPSAGAQTGNAQTGNAHTAGIQTGGAQTAAATSSAKKIGFNAQVRAILSENCFSCHGPDENTREAGLRLDEREAAIDYGALAPDDPDASSLLQRITETDDDLVMPPPSSKKGRLSDEQVAVLRQWIAEGAEYEPHWAFAPLKRSAAPEVADGGWATGPIDRFVLHRLQSHGVIPSPEADRNTLIRRVYLDLTGVLPTPQQVEWFLADERPDAYERLVDSLLMTPEFAERWARHWLDQARYADSHGYSIDSQRAMWPYRDWVIRATADDMPFDQFTLEQLAGDLLPDATKLQKIASAFHRNTLINQEGGVDNEQFRHEAVIDRVNTTGAVWLGLTVACAQCHTHKYDPIDHREYYELSAFFNSGSDVNNTGATVPVLPGEVFGTPTSPQDQQRQQQRRQLEQRLLAQWQQAAATVDEAMAPTWHQLAWSQDELDRGAVSGLGDHAHFESLPDGSLLVVGRPHPNSTYRAQLAASAVGLLNNAADQTAAGTAPAPATSTATLGGIRLRVLTHDSLPNNGPGTAGNGNFVLTDFQLLVNGQPLRPAYASADHQQPDYPVAHAIDGDAHSGWAINVGSGAAASGAVMNANHEATFGFDPPVEIPAGAELTIVLRHDRNTDYLIGRLAIDIAAQPPSRQRSAIDRQLISDLQRPAHRRTTAQQKRVTEALQAAFSDQADLFALPPAVSLMVMSQLPQRRETFVSLRGDFLRPDLDVGPLSPGGIAAITPPLPAGEQRTRIDLAQWLTSRENPLTPRVTVNRVWMHYFGAGLVETEEDFGTQGTAPSHPRLLDWLALSFQDSDYSLKALHRQIVTSRTYRQASHHRPDLEELDPRNRLLARQNRVRVDAEVVRDAALAASGQLQRTVGGRSVHPPQPDGVYAFTQTSKRWLADQGGDRFRRAMYTEFFRSAPYPLFTTFDAPDFQTVCTRRNRSNTPLQALTVANDEVFVELARAMALRVLRETYDLQESAELRESANAAIDYAFLVTLSRRPTAAEQQIARDLMQRLIDQWDQAGDGEPAAWLGPDAASFRSLAGTDHAAALVALCRTLLNTDNFITRE